MLFIKFNYVCKIDLVKSLSILMREHELSVSELMGHRNKSPADCYPFLRDRGDDLSTWRHMPIY
jgi:hypothetical protein